MAINIDVNSMWIRADRALQGRYSLLGRLGSGGMGMVFLVQARDLSGRHFALKVIDKTSPENAGVDVYAEIQIMKGLRHPNIVTVFEAVEDDRFVYIIQDYIDGRSLAELRDDRTAYFDEETVRLWMIDIAEALAYLHSMNIVHRDIKPGNIMINSDGNAMLIDFGIARRMATISRRKVGSTVGSAPYSPLERLQGQADSPQTDIYAYGTTFYSLLMRKVPSVSGREINTLRTSNQSIEPYYMNAYRTMVNDLGYVQDDGIREVLRGCVEIDPARRFRDFNTIRYRLRSIDEVRETHRVQKSEYTKAKRLMAAMLVVGIVLAGLGIVQMKRDHDHRFDKIIDQADEAYEACDFNKSEETAAEAIEFDPNNEAGYITRYKAVTGEAYELNDDDKYRQLISDISADIAEQPALADNLYVNTYLANAYFETDDAAKAADLLRSRDDLGDDQLMLLGHALYKTGRDGEAMSCLERMSGDTPQKFYLEGLISESDSVEAAVSCYRKVLDVEDQNHEYGELKRKAVSQIAQLYMDRDMYPRAVQTITDEMTANPALEESAKLNIMLMDCYSAMKDYDSAVSQADVVIEKFNNSGAYDTKVYAQGELGDYSGALKTIDAWEEAFPADAKPHIQRVIIYNNIAGAAKTDSEMLRTYPDFINAYETESRWLTEHDAMNDEFRNQLDRAYLDAKRTLEEIRSED